MLPRRSDSSSKRQPLFVHRLAMLAPQDTNGNSLPRIAERMTTQQQLALLSLTHSSPCLVVMRRGPLLQSSTPEADDFNAPHSVGLSRSHSPLRAHRAAASTLASAAAALLPASAGVSSGTGEGGILRLGAGLLRAAAAGEAAGDPRADGDPRSSAGRGPTTEAAIGRPARCCCGRSAAAAGVAAGVAAADHES